MRTTNLSRLINEVQVPDVDRLKKERRLLEDLGPITQTQLHDFEANRRERRDNLMLFSHPVDTLKVFFRACIAAVLAATKYICLHSVNLYFIVPSIILWLILERFPGPHRVFVDMIEFAVVYVVWWVGLGTLSSIGVGSGLQSGILFLYPHVIKVCFVAQTCNSLDFESESDIWFQSPKQLFKCRPINPTAPHTPVTVFNVWRTKVLLVCFLHAAGTAIGEIPPYWMTKSARIAAIEAGNASLASNGGTTSSSSSGNNSSYSNNNNNNETEEPPGELLDNHGGWIDVLKVWMVKFLKTHGFKGVLLLASFPNLLFDVCGICCGYFLMPFSTFFAATFMGKAIIRNSYQSVIYVILCSEKHLRELISFLQYLTPKTWKLHNMIKTVLLEARDSFKNLSQQGAAAQNESLPGSKRSSGEMVMYYWQLFTVFLFVAFLVSCISHIAQYYQLTVDQEDIDKLKARLPTESRNAYTVSRSPEKAGRNSSSAMITGRLDKVV